MWRRGGVGWNIVASAMRRDVWRRREVFIMFGVSKLRGCSMGVQWRNCRKR